MAKKPAELSRFQVNVETPQADKACAPRKGKTAVPAVATPLVTKGFRVKPAAARQFDMLKAEAKRQGKPFGLLKFRTLEQIRGIARTLLQ